MARARVVFLYDTSVNQRRLLPFLRLPNALFRLLLDIVSWARIITEVDNSRKTVEAVSDGYVKCFSEKFDNIGVSKR